MSIEITIVDYGVGNLLSVRSALEHCGATPVMATTPEQVLGADRLLLPGVGAFGDSINGMRRTGLFDPVREQAARGTPVLGICLGMQMLLSDSEEFGHHEGLELIPGHVRAVPDTGADGEPHRIPHVGWAAINPVDGGGDWTGSVLEGLAHGTAFFFVHSFHAQPAESAHLLAACDYDGRRIGAVIRRDNIMGCQFHPEKSAAAGLSVLGQFLKI